MGKTLTFYFDFMSPYAYLAHSRLARIKGKYELFIVPKVVDLAFVKRAVGNTGPRNVDIPAKIKYLQVDLTRWAERYEIPLVFPASLDSEKMNMCALYADKKGALAPFLDLAWRKCWATGLEMSAPEHFQDISNQMGWDHAALLAYLESSDAREAFRAGSIKAVEQGVFGVPIMMIDGQMWWGNDRIDLLIEYIS